MTNRNHLYMDDNKFIIEPVIEQYPDVQAIYLFGSYATENERPDSDIDVAILLPVNSAKQINLWQWLELANVIAMISHRKKADLINLRQVDVVLRKEIIIADRCIFRADENAVDEFEMLTLSFYQQLQTERQGIIRDALNSGRFRDV